MWSLFILFLVTLWAIACLVWVLRKWLPPDDEVHRPHSGRFGEP
jgi:hypothetical protein